MTTAPPSDRPAGPRLGSDGLDRLPAAVAKPRYDRARQACGVVHLGVGNFFRAHQAVVFDDAMNAGASDWAVCGVSLRSADTRNALAPQDGLYTLLVRDAAADRPRVVGALRELLVAPESPQAVVARLAAPGVRWVTLTITEKGYGHRLGEGLDPGHPDIAHDLARPDAPRSAVGLLHAAARLRRVRGLAGLTVVSCDNLSGNGTLLARLIGDFDAARGTGLAGWIGDAMRFPDTMIDRIVPRTTDADRALAQRLTGRADAWPVSTEPFTQWIVQDAALGGRPPLPGIEWVPDVRPYETMKLRLLNAAHSALAWLGAPAGFATVDAAIAEPALRAFVQRLWQDEVIPTLPTAIADRAPAYCAALLDRFANPALAHRTAQIAMDGSQKLPLRILPSLRSRRAAGAPAAALTLVIAAWIRYLAGHDECGGRSLAEDPLAHRLAGPAGDDDPLRATAAVLAERAVFGDDLSADPRFAADVAAALHALRRDGTLRSVVAYRGTAAT